MEKVCKKKRRKDHFQVMVDTEARGVNSDSLNGSSQGTICSRMRVSKLGSLETSPFACVRTVCSSGRPICSSLLGTQDFSFN